MISLRDLLVEEERRKDMMREAEKRRLIKAVSVNRFHDRLLAGLGRSLTGWGMRLQARYGAIAEIPPGCYNRGKLDSKTLAAKTETA